MNKRDLLLCTILVALSFFSLLSFEKRGFKLASFEANTQVEAACSYAAYCDANGTTCNGGNPCYIGNTTTIGTYNYSNCFCNGNSGANGSCNSGNIGSTCGSSPYGVCGCEVNHGTNVTCTDVYISSCGSGNTCGWGNWTACSVACGGGTQSRYNSCTGATQVQDCNTQACPTPVPTPGASPVPCTFGGWGACSVACGGGTQTRSDNCGNTQTQSCNTQECPCNVGAWSSCSNTCGQGTQSRTNDCVAGGIETQACNTCSLGCSCTMACGQSTVCGTCPSTGFGTTAAVTLNPSSGNLTIPANRQVTVSWSAPAGADSYDVQIYPTNTEVGSECTDPNTFCLNGTTATNYTFTAPTGVPSYSWKVRTNNTTCDAIDYMTATASDEYHIAEGSAYEMTADKAVDGGDDTAWNAGGFPTQWIELDLKGNRTISGMRMATNHFPDGQATFSIYAGATASPSALVQTITQNIVAGDVLNVTFSSPVSNVRYIRVVTTDDVSWTGWSELTPYFSDGVGSWTSGTFNLVGPVAGNFYLDQSATASLNLATGLCEMSGALTGQNPGTSSAIAASWAGGGSATGSITGSTYTINNVSNNLNVGATLSPDASTWRCTCPFGCTYSGLSVPSSNVNYFLASVAQPWWQTKNGLVYAGSTSGNALVSLIPSTCTGACVGDLSLRNALNASESSGLAITGGGDIDTDQDNALRYTKLRQETTQNHVVGSIYNGPRENYQYFYNLYSMGSAPSVDFDGSQPSANPVNGRAYYASSGQTISTAWHVTGGQKLVIFVNGNLNINNTIKVDEGSFLAFIVNGNITVANTVGNTTATDSSTNVEGVYIADRIIIQGGLAGGDKRFVGAGTFVGWSSVTMGRSYGTASTNDTASTELFIFRPDFVQNVPARMTRPLYSWQETN